MAELFSAAWMGRFQDMWNADEDLVAALSDIAFCSVIGYGIDGEDAPRGVLKIESGKAVAGGPYNGGELNWDLRATEDQWHKWMEKPPGMMGLGMAYTSRKLKFVVGDYTAMIKDPRMAGPFIKSFSVMGRV